MKRREFIVTLGGAVAWPLAAYAQQPATKAPRIGWLVTGSPTSYRASLAAFRDGLKALGHVEGHRTLASSTDGPKAISPAFRNWPMS